MAPDTISRLHLRPCHRGNRMQRLATRTFWLSFVTFPALLRRPPARPELCESVRNYDWRWPTGNLDYRNG